MLHSTEEVRNRPTGQNGAPVMGPPATEQRLEENPPQNSHISSPEHSVLHFNPGSAIVPPFSNEQDLGHAREVSYPEASCIANAS